MEIRANRSNQAEVANCSFVKTVLMLIVVFYHSILFWNGNWFNVRVPVFQAPVLGKLALWLNSFHIYGFTLVSGYLFCFLRYEKGKYRVWGDFLKNKAKRLLVPYLFIAVAWVIPIGYYFFSFSWSDIIKRFALAASPNQLWFIVMLFDVFVIFEFLSDFFFRHDVKGLLTVLVLYVVGGRWLPNTFQIRLACKYAIFFWIGFKIRQHGSYRIRKIPSAVWVLTSVALFAAQMVISRQEHPLCKVINTGVTLALNLVGEVMAFVVLQKIADVVDWKNNALILFLNKHAMVVYLLHQQVIYFLISWFNGIVNPYLNTIINFAGSMAISLLISALLMSYRWTRFLVGEK